MSKWKFPNHRRERGRLITLLIARQGSTCALCGCTLNRKIRDSSHPAYITFDHIVPVSRGGSAALSNIRLACRHCNELRGNDWEGTENEIFA